MRDTPGRLTAFVVVCALFCLPHFSAGQQPNSPKGDTSEGTITGIVKDVGGTVIPDAHVTLSSAAVTFKTNTDAAGRFTFTDVPAGRFTLTVAEEDLAGATLAGTLHAGETYETPPIVLRIATAHTSVDVTMTQEEIAEQDMHAQEQQRVLAIIPNFFVSYKPNAPPLTAKQKFKLAFRGTYDPYTFISTGVVAGIEQADDTLPGYEQGFSGYAKRYGATYTNGASATLLRGAVFPSLFHQDPRYFYLGRGSVWHRALYAMSTAFICKGDNGKWQPNYSSVFANLSAGALANLYFPAGSRNGASTTIEDGMLATAGVAAGHLMQEFVFNHLTTHRKANTPAGQP